MEHNTNRYELIKNLKEYIYKVENADIVAFDVLLSEIKAYIYNNEILKNEYEKRINEFAEYRKTEEFKENLLKVYKRINAMSIRAWAKTVKPAISSSKLDEIISKTIASNKEHMLSFHYTPEFSRILEPLFPDVESNPDLINFQTFSKNYNNFNLFNFSNGIFMFYDFVVAIGEDSEGLFDSNSRESELWDPELNKFYIKIDGLLDFYFLELEDYIMDELYSYRQVSHLDALLLKIAIREVMVELITFLNNKNNLFSDVKIASAIKTPNQILINFDAYPELKQLTGKEREIFLLVGQRLKINEIAKMPESFKSQSTVAKQITSCANKLQETGLTKQKGQAAIFDVYSRYKNC